MKDPISGSLFKQIHGQDQDLQDPCWPAPSIQVLSPRVGSLVAMHNINKLFKNIYGQEQDQDQDLQDPCWLPSIHMYVVTTTLDHFFENIYGQDQDQDQDLEENLFSASKP